MSDPIAIYHYDDAGAYLGETSAQMSPREPDVPLVPRHATLDAPPAAGSGEVAVFIAGGWSLIEDHRGETVYSESDGSALEITAPGPIPAGYVDQPRPSEYHLWEAGAWVHYPPPPPTDAERIDAAFPQSDVARVIFEALYELTNRVRTLEGNAAITRAQLRDWLITKLPQS
jgi:hypothetical protein